ncbi:hypothetical protein GN156_06855 [bacterium LRH843]|nr:hypothetical protein [bacterium LRH843]
MKRKTRRNMAAVLAFMILLQPILSISMQPFISSVVYAEETEGGGEEKEPPKPGVKNADDEGKRVNQGTNFPSPGGKHSNGSGGSGGSGTGNDNSILDPDSLLDPSRPKPQPDRNSDPPVNDKGNGDPSNVDPSNGNGTGGGDLEGSENQAPGSTTDSKTGNPDSATDPNGEKSDSANDDRNNKDPSKNENGSSKENEDEAGTGDRNSQDPNENSPSEGDKSTLDIIKDNVKSGKDYITLVELYERYLSGQTNSSDVLFLLGKLKVTDNEEVQKGYETLISQAVAIKGVGSEIKDTHAIRYSNEKGSIKFKDWFKFNTYKDTFIDHTKDSMTDHAYRTIYGEDKTQLIKNSDANKLKLTSPATWLKAGVKKTLDIGGKIASGIDRGIQFLGNGVSSIANGADSLLSKGINGLRSLTETVGTSISNAKSSATKTLLTGVNKVIGATDRGMSMLSSVAGKASQIGQSIANSTFGKTLGNAVTSVKNAGSSIWQSGANLVNKVAESKVGRTISAVVNSPLGKIGGVALSGFSIWSGAMDLTSDGPWHKKVAGGFSVVGGVLGIAGIVAAGTAAAPVLVAGAFVAGVGALAFTYGPKLVNAWNNSKVGKTVNKAVKDGVKAVGNAATTAGKAIANTASNLVSNISSGIAGLFGK